jgi:DUF3006 family protein
VRVQLDRFEDNGMVVLLLYPHGRESFDVPRELLPGNARTRDGLEVSFARDWRETERMAAENEKLLEELLGRDG